MDILERTTKADTRYQTHRWISSTLS